jgi:RNA polymerase sigma-70 factor (ECF subfamily)
MGLMLEGLAPGVIVPSLRARPANDFTAWMESEQRRVFLLCYRILQDRDEADTATQDAFLKAYRALEKPGAETPDEPARWISRIAINTCLDRLRSRRWRFWRRRPRPEDEAVILSLAADTAPDAEDQTFAVELKRRLARAIEGLSDRQRAVFVLRHYEDRSLEEIGQLLGLETGTVKAHMARALEKLRQELKDLYDVL